MYVTEKQNTTITEREIFEDNYVTKWKVCMDIASQHLLKFFNQKDINCLPWDALLAATAQLFICWNQNEGYIKNLKEEAQRKINTKGR